MSNNCLVTTLKGVVNDNNLLKLGEMRFYTFGSSTPIRVKTFPKTGTTLTLKIISGGVFYNNDSDTIEVTTDNASSIRVTAASTISVMEKYNIASLGQEETGNSASSKNLNIDDLKYTEGMTCLSIGTNTQSTGSISSLAASASTIQYLELGGPNIDYTLIEMPNLQYCMLFPTDGTIDINELMTKCPSITTIGGYYSGNISAFSGNTTLVKAVLGLNHTLSGNISSFGGNTNLTKLEVNQTEISGKLSDILSCTALNRLVLSEDVEYTTADADAMDAILSGNGATATWSHTENGSAVNRYFNSGTWVEAYS